MYNMVATSLIFATIISIAVGAPATINTDKIKTAVSQLECVSNAILSIDQKHGLGDFWMPIYFPLLMHSNSMYECQLKKSQIEADECVDEEMLDVSYTLVDFLGMVHENNSDVSQEIHSAIINKCGLIVPSPNEFNYLPEKVSIKKLKKFLNIEHVKCVVQALVVSIGDNEDVLDWVKYHVELKDSVQKLVACNSKLGMDKKKCYAKELGNTVRIMFDLWQFFSEKKHTQILSSIRTQIKDQCYQQTFLM